VRSRIALDQPDTVKRCVAFHCRDSRGMGDRVWEQRNRAAAQGFNGATVKFLMFRFVFLTATAVKSPSSVTWRGGRRRCARVTGMVFKPEKG
jgi:hypothetical protein